MRFSYPKNHIHTHVESSTYPYLLVRLSLLFILLIAVLSYAYASSSTHNPPYHIVDSPLSPFFTLPPYRNPVGVRAPGHSPTPAQRPRPNSHLLDARAGPREPVVDLNRQTFGLCIEGNQNLFLHPEALNDSK